MPYPGKDFQLILFYPHPCSPPETEAASCKLGRKAFTRDLEACRKALDGRNQPGAVGFTCREKAKHETRWYRRYGTDQVGRLEEKMMAAHAPSTNGGP